MAAIGRDWSDCGGYERESFRDEARRQMCGWIVSAPPAEADQPVQLRPAMSNAHAIVAAATADIGKASGLEAAAKVLLAMADHNRRVVGTGELKAAALALQENAAEIRAKAKEALRPFTQSNVQ